MSSNSNSNSNSLINHNNNINNVNNLKLLLTLNNIPNNTCEENAKILETIVNQRLKCGCYLFIPSQDLGNSFLLNIKAQTNEFACSYCNKVGCEKEVMSFSLNWGYDVEGPSHICLDCFDKEKKTIEFGTFGGFKITIGHNTINLLPKMRVIDKSRFGGFGGFGNYDTECVDKKDIQPNVESIKKYTDYHWKK